MIVDAHHHFWRYDPAQYDWIDDEMAALRRDFLPEDLEITKRAAGVGAVVSVQARQSIEETDFLLEEAQRHGFIAGVVGWAPLVSPTVDADLDRFAAHAKLKGLRHVLQGEPDGYMLRDEFSRGLRSLRPHGLVYDILIYEHQLPQAIELVDRHPEQPFVLDHSAKPPIRAREIEPWRTRLRELARRPHVTCKLSGLVTEADYLAWTGETLRPYVETVIECFGPGRVLFGSDWPVCLVACEYEAWVGLVQGYVARMSSDERAAILGGTAQRVYGLELEGAHDA
jgi:L-fuconolactonase